MWIGGMEGYVTVNGTSLSATGWLNNWVADTVDVSNFKGYGWSSYLSGVPDFDLQFEVIWNDDEDPFGSVDLFPGEQMEALLMLSNERGIRYRFPNIVIYEVNQEQSVRDTNRYKVFARGSAYTEEFTVETPDAS